MAPLVPPLVEENRETAQNEIQEENVGKKNTGEEESKNGEHVGKAAAA